MSLLRRPAVGLAEPAGVEVEFVALDDFDFGELLAQRLDEVLSVADDDDGGVRRAEARAGELLYLRGRHRLHARDVAVDLVEAQPVQRERRDLRDEPLGRLKRAAEVA